MKKAKLLYRFENESRNAPDIAEELIKNILVKATPSSSCWWSKMKARSDNFKSRIEAIKNKQIEWFKGGADVIPDSSGTTAKTCPGIVGLLTKAYLIKCPTEVVITVNKDGGYYYNLADESILKISPHSKEQFYQQDNQHFKGKIAINIHLLVSFKTTGFDCIITDPTYHSKSDFFVPTGLLSKRHSVNQELHVIAFIDLPTEDETKTFVIDAGDVLAYLIPFEECTLSFSEDNFGAKRFKSNFNFKKNT